MAEVKLISVWKRRPREYKLEANQVMVELAIKIKGFWTTRHLSIKKSDPVLAGQLLN